MTTQEEIRAHILEFLRDEGASIDLAERMPDDFDLRRDGAIDSLHFIRLLADLELRAGRPIDLTDVDPQLLTVLGVLVSHVAKQIGAVSTS